MSPIHSIRVTAEHLPAEEQEYVYSIASVELVFSREVPRLHSFYVGSRVVQYSETKFDVVGVECFELNYHGTAPFANSLRDVKFRRSDDIAQLDIDHVPACQISFSQNHIHVINNESFDSEINLELLTGPALILFLAQCNIFCLHAGAVSTPVGNIAIIAESGAGKSTLSGHSDDSWSQLADDILPVIGVNIEPNFPQLKLPNSIASGALTNGAQLKAIFRIKLIPSKEIHFKTLNSVEALLQVVRHTVAAKLFDHSMMAAHMAFATKLVSELDVVELSYPRDLSQLSDLKQAIINHIS